MRQVGVEPARDVRGSVERMISWKSPSWTSPRSRRTGRGGRRRLPRSAARPPPRSAAGRARGRARPPRVPVALGVCDLGVLGGVRDEEIERRGPRAARSRMASSRAGVAAVLLRDDEHLCVRVAVDRPRSRSRRACVMLRNVTTTRIATRKIDARHGRAEPEPAVVARLREQVAGRCAERPREDVRDPEREDRVELQPVVERGHERDRRRRRARATRRSRH